MAHQKDWLAWHRDYDDPSSSLARRLRVVQQELAAAINSRSGPVRLIAMCAGQGRDSLPVIAAHPQRRQISATLVELDPRNVAVARAEAASLCLDNVEIVEGDAASTDTYAGLVPADIVIACGIFGNISDADICFTIQKLPTLCAARATVLWTRARTAERDLAEDVRAWFNDAGFEEISHHAPDDAKFRVGVCRLARPPRPFERGVHLFQFLR